MKKGYLVLENGQVFEGERFGAPLHGIGELVFTTGMCGYIETLTDPSYYGQIVMQTFPQIGNYGVISKDFEGKCAVRGYVVREYCTQPSNFRCETTLDEYLKAVGVPGLCGVDTREITRIIRENGTMNAILCDEIPDDLSEVRAYTVHDAVASVTCGERRTVPAVETADKRVALIDYGAKANIARSLSERGCTVDIFPAAVAAEEILSGGYDGVMLSNGPGDPTENGAHMAAL